LLRPEERVAPVTPRLNPRPSHPDRQDLGVLAVLLVGVPYLLWRCSLVDLFWIDEMYSITLANHPWGKALELTTFDAHPPGYYFLLKAWLNGVRLLGVEPGFVLTRAPGVLAWALLVAATWCGARRLLGRACVLLAVLALCLCGNVVHMTTEARQYALIVPATAVCWMLLMGQALDHAEGRVSAARSRRMWAGFAAIGAAGLWMQLLMGPMMAVLAVLWAWLCARRAWWRTTFFRHGLWAHIAMGLLILPWLDSLRHNIGHLDFMPRPWQTPATPLNLLTVFFYWMPLGHFQFGFPAPQPWPRHPVWYEWNVLAYPAAASVLVPLIVWLRALRRGRGPGDARLATVAACGLGTAIGFVFLIWWFDRWGIARTFHGTRYPMVALGPWVIGLVAWCAWSVRRLEWQPARVWWTMAPWLVCAVAGQLVVYLIVQQPNHALAREKGIWRPPPAGATVYTMPSEFLPYVRPVFPEYDLRPVDELTHLPADAQTAWVFNASPLLPSMAGRDLAFYSLLDGHRLAARTLAAGYPTGYPVLTVFRLEQPDRTMLARMATEDWSRMTHDIPADAVAAAVPEQQSMLDGWSMIEFGARMSLHRWGGAREVRLRFDAAVEPGRHILHVRGYRGPYPTDVAPMRLQFQREATVHAFEQPEGGFHLRLPFDFAHRHDPPVLLLAHPTWKPRDHVAGALDPRDLTILLNEAWLEKAED
jgi:hypothetical protein